MKTKIRLIGHVLRHNQFITERKINGKKSKDDRVNPSLKKFSNRRVSPLHTSSSRRQQHDMNNYYDNKHALKEDFPEFDITTTHFAYLHCGKIPVECFTYFL